MKVCSHANLALLLAQPHAPSRCSTETGKPGTRTCAEQVKPCKLRLHGYIIEYRLPLAQITDVDKARMGPTCQLWKRQRQALWDARLLIARHVADVESSQRPREQLLMQLEDPLETVDIDEARYFDTDVVHGAMQRVQAGQVPAMLAPLMQRSINQLVGAQQADNMALRYLMQLAAGQMGRIVKGFVWKLRVQRMENAFLAHLAAISIQRIWRGYFARKYLMPLYWARFRTRMAVHIQRIVRGWLKRLWFKRVIRHRRRMLESAAATKIQAVVRGWGTYKDREEVWEDAVEVRRNWEVTRTRRLQRARERRWRAENLAATKIQAVVRGMLARRDAYMRKQAGFISHPKLRELADAYLSGGDLWGLLAAVNQELEQQDTMRANDTKQADAFIRQLVSLRQRDDKASTRIPAGPRAGSHVPTNYAGQSAESRVKDAEVAVLESLFLNTSGKRSTHTGLKFVVDRSNNAFLAARSQPDSMPASESKHSTGHESVHTAGQDVLADVVYGNEELVLPADAAEVLRSHQSTAAQQGLIQPIDGRNPLDALIPADVTRTLAGKLPLPNETKRRPPTPHNVEVPTEADIIRARKEREPKYRGPRRFTADEQPAHMAMSASRGSTALGAGATAASGTFTAASLGSRSGTGPAADEQRHVQAVEEGWGATRSMLQGDASVASSAPQLYQSSMVQVDYEPMEPGGPLKDADGYFRPHVMAAILQHVDRVATRELVLYDGPEQHDDEDPATAFMVSHKKALQWETKFRLRQLRKGEIAEGRDRLDGDMEAAPSFVLPENEKLVTQEDVTIAMARQLAKETSQRVANAIRANLGEKEEKQQAAQGVTTGATALAETQGKTYRQVQYENALEKSRLVAGGLLVGIAETVESILVRERMDDALARAIVSASTASGAGPEGFTRLTASGLLQSTSANALSKALSRQSVRPHTSASMHRAETPASPGMPRPGTAMAAAVASISPMAASRGTSSMPATSAAASHAPLRESWTSQPMEYSPMPTAKQLGAPPHIERTGSVARQTHREILQAGYAALHGRDEHTNPMGSMYARENAEKEIRLQQTDAAKATARRQQIFAAAAKARGAEVLADAFLGDSGSPYLPGSAGNTTPSGDLHPTLKKLLDEPPNFDFNDEPLAAHAGTKIDGRTEEEVRREQLLQMHTGSKPNISTLLRDVRSMNGPADSLVLHAALRTVPVPAGALVWAKENGMQLSARLMQLSESGKALAVFSKTSVDVKPGPDAFVLGESFIEPAVGEEAAAVFEQMPACLAKIVWEDRVLDMARPMIQWLHARHARTVSQVDNIDLQKAPLDPLLTATVQRLLCVLRAAVKMQSASTVRSVFAANPVPAKPPLVGPYAAQALLGEHAARGASTRVAEFSALPGAHGPFDVNASSVFPQPGDPAATTPDVFAGTSMFSGTTSQGLATTHALSGATQDRVAQAQGSTMLATPSHVDELDMAYKTKAPEQHPHVVMTGTQSSGLVAGGVTVDTAAGDKRVHLTVTQTVNTGHGGPMGSTVGAGAALGARSLQPSQASGGRPGARSDDLFVPGGTHSQDAIAYGVKRVHPSIVTGDDDDREAHEAPVYVQAGLYQGFGAGYFEPGKAMSMGELHQMFNASAAAGAAGAPFQFLTSGTSEGDILREAHRQQAREHAATMADALGMPVATGLRAGPDDHPTTRMEVLRLPWGFSVLQRDEALNAVALTDAISGRQTRLERDEKVLRAAEAGMGLGVAQARRRLERDAKERQAHLAEARKEEEAKAQDAKRSAFAKYYAAALSGSATQQGMDADEMQREELRAARQQDVTGMLHSMHTGLNGLVGSDLEGPVDPLCLQVAFTLPIPCPRLTAIVDHRTGVTRTMREAERVVVPYDLFLRQLIGYNLPGSVEGKMDDAGGTKKQRMLVKERVKSATLMAKPWIAALNRWGFSKLGQTIGIPRPRLVEVLGSAWPIQVKPGMNSIEKACSALNDMLQPSDVATSMQAALRHWQNYSPAEFSKLRASSTSFDPKYQRGPTDISGKPAVGRQLATVRRMERGLGSASWSTFAKKDLARKTQGWAQSTRAAELQGTLLRRPSSATRQAAVTTAGSAPIPDIDSVAPGDLASFNLTQTVARHAAGDRAPALVSPMWFGTKENLKERMQRYNPPPKPVPDSNATLNFVHELLRTEPPAAAARTITGSAGGVHLARESMMSGAPQLPHPVQSTVQYVHSSGITGEQRDMLGVTAAGAVDMEFQYGIQTAALASATHAAAQHGHSSYGARSASGRRRSATARSAGSSVIRGQR